MNGKVKDQFLNRTQQIRDSLVERIEQVASNELSHDEIKQIKELTAVVRELDKMVRENRGEIDSAHESCNDFLEEIISKSIIEEK